MHQRHARVFRVGEPHDEHTDSTFGGEGASCSSGDSESQWCLFDLILYVPSTIFQLNRDWSSWVEPVLSKDK